MYTVGDLFMVRVKTIITTEKRVYFTVLYSYDIPVMFLNTKMFSIQHKTHKTNHK
jgi:hypothetical protein